jgi:predicted porin
LWQSNTDAEHRLHHLVEMSASTRCLGIAIMHPGHSRIKISMDRLSFSSLAACMGMTLPLMAFSQEASAEVSFHPAENTLISLYGVFDIAGAYTTNQSGRSHIYASQGSLTANRLGLRGEVGLGGDMQALFRLESGFDVVHGKFGTPSYFFNRQAFAGVSHKRWGTLTLGRQYTPYFHYVGALGPVNVLTAATGAHPGDLDAMDATLRLNNSLTYALPKLGGWQASAQYGMEGSTGHFSRGSTLSAAVRYDYRHFSWSAGYIGLDHIPLSRAIATFANSAPITRGYRSADNARIFGTAGQYASGAYMVGLNYSNVRYLPDATSSFRETAMFNTIGAISSYAATPSLTLAAGYSYTAEAARNGVSEPARYHQVSLSQQYVLSKHVAFYAVQGYQTAHGKTLGLVNGLGAVVDALASVGDSQNDTPSSTGHQFVAIVGVRFSL